MQCDRAQEFFSDYLERTLDRPMTVALEAHLAGCSGCREEIEGLRDTLLALEAVPAVEPPADGAWQVMCQLRRQRAERFEAERRRAPSFAEWLRSFNPLGVAMGAGLATLVIAGTLVLPGVMKQHIMNGPPLPTPVRAVQAVPEGPSVVVAYAGQTAAGHQVNVQVAPYRDLPDAQITITGDRLLQNVQATGRVNRGTVVPFNVTIPAESTVASLRIAVQSPVLSKPYSYLVVMPLAPRRGPVSLAVSYQPVEQALREIAPYLGKPVVADGDLQGTINLQADERDPLSVLRDVAAQAQASVVTETSAYRLVPNR